VLSGPVAQLSLCHHVNHPTNNSPQHATNTHNTHAAIKHRQVDAAILKLHSRRVTCLAFPLSSNSHVVSGDKRGGIAIWNFSQVSTLGQVAVAVQQGMQPRHGHQSAHHQRSKTPQPHSVCAQVHDRVLYDSIHSTGGVVNDLAPSPWLPGGFDCASASADGTVKLFDIEIGVCVLRLSRDRE
jgi:DNA damage-binding protein 2